MRIGDRERDAAIDELRRHAGAGRLDPEELEDRIEAALAARTNDELAELGSDLPPPPPESDFGVHLRVYLAIQLMLVAIWALTGAGYFWPVWPALGWGIAVVLHGVCDPGRGRAWPAAQTSRTRGIASS